MESRRTISLNDAAAFCMGESLSDSDLEDELRQLDEQYDSEMDMDDDNDEAERVENLLCGAYSSSQPSHTATPAERDSLLNLDPDFQTGNHL